MNLKELRFLPNLKSVKFFPMGHTSHRHISVKRQLNCPLAFSVVSVKYTGYCLIKFRTLLFVSERKSGYKELNFVSKRSLFLCKGIQRYVITILYQWWVADRAI